MGEGRSDPVDPHRAGDVLEALLAQILEGAIEPALDLALDDRRDADPARLGERFQPRRDIDAVAVDVAVLDDDVARIDADAELDALVLRGRGVARRHALLHRDRAGDGFDDARELDEDAVAGGLDDAALVLGDLAGRSARGAAR